MRLDNAHTSNKEIMKLCFAIVLLVLFALDQNSYLKLIGRRNTLNVLTIKAKAALTATRLCNLLGKSNRLSKSDLVDVIETSFIADVPTKPKYMAAAFSSIVGCGIFGIEKNNLICIIPPQAPAHLKDLSKEKLIDGHLGDIKLETERIARIICAALNEA